MIGIANEKIFI
jgi:hypothetical protein